MDLDFPAQLGQTPEKRLPRQLSHPRLICRPFPSLGANPFYNQPQGINFPCFFRKPSLSLLLCMLNCLLTLLLLVGEDKKPSQILPNSFPSPSRTTNDRSTQEHTFAGGY